MNIHWAQAENVGGFLVTSTIIWGGMRCQFELWKQRRMAVAVRPVTKLALQG